MTGIHFIDVYLEIIGFALCVYHVAHWYFKKEIQTFYKKEKKMDQVEVAHQEILLTVGEVAKILRVDATTVRRWVRSGCLQAIRLPHCRKREQYRIKTTTLESLLEGTSDVLI